MAAREDLGSWLEGPGSGDGSHSPERRLGLPAGGSGSLAPLGRRIVALLIDWALCLLIARAFLGADPLAPILVLAFENTLLLATLGHTLGHRLLGIQVRLAPSAAGSAAPGGPVGLPRAALRTLLLALVIPAVVWDADGRGLHDRVAGTVLVRR